MKLFSSRAPRAAPALVIVVLSVAIFVLAAVPVHTEPAATSACCEAGPMGSTEPLRERRGAPYPAVRFMVAGDLHVLAPELWSESPAFGRLMSRMDGRLVRESSRVAAALESAVRREDPAFLLVTGDLTFNGSKASHELVSAVFSRIESSGVPVYVVPGNHDINNPWASTFTGERLRSVSRVDPTAFRRIYAAFGFDEARSTAPDSLGYVANVAPGLDILAIDSNRYERNIARGHPASGGAISPDQADWMERQLVASQDANRAVVPLMHHSLLDHRAGSGSGRGSASWIDLWPRYARLFWDTAAPVVFTGHIHDQNIAGLRGDEDEWLYDVATGALVAYPHNYRIVTIGEDGVLHVGEGRLTADDLDRSNGVSGAVGEARVDSGKSGEEILATSRERAGESARRERRRAAQPADRKVEIDLESGRRRLAE